MEKLQTQKQIIRMRNNLTDAEQPHTFRSDPALLRSTSRRYTDRFTSVPFFAMPRLSVVVVSVLLGTLLSLPAAAQWKWRDKGGQMQYSDLPPPAHVAERDILQRPTTARAPMAVPAASAASAPVLAPKTIEPELEAKQRKADEEQAAKKKAEEEKLAAVRAENCNRAKGYMRTLDDGIRIARVNDKGEREILDDKQRAEETKRTRDIIASDCK